MLIITFLQQEFVLLPELLSFDLVGEDAKAKMLEQWRRWRWLAFLSVPLLLLMRLFLVSLCLYIGGFFFSGMSSFSFKEWWSIAMKAQVVIIAYSIILCLLNVINGTDMALDFTRYTSVLFLGGDSVEPWIKLPLSAINVFEVFYWLLLSLLTMKLCGRRFGKSLTFVMSSYGVGYFFYIVLLMFLMLYLN